MSLRVLDLAFWMVGIRGHSPRDGGYGNGRGDRSMVVSPRLLLRVLTAFVATVGLLALALWAAVWLTIRLL